MSKIDLTTQDLFMRLGSTTMSRSARADALFRRLRLDQQEALLDRLTRAPATVEPLLLTEEDRAEPVR